MVAWIVFVSIVTPGVLSMMGWFFVRLLKSVDERFEQIDKRFEQVDYRFEQVDKRFEQVEQRVDKRFEKIENHLERHDEKFDRLRDDIAKLSQDHYRLDVKLEGLIAAVQQMQQQLAPQTEKAA